MTKNKNTYFYTFIFFISIICFIFLQILINKYHIKLKSNTEIGKEIMQKNFQDLSNINNIATNNENTKTVNTIWQIKIPKINLIANIKEGTDEETLNQFVGHFEETQRQDGNIGLAAHNRGYEVNYFARLRELKKGDEIIYQYKNYNKTYEVIRVLIIKDTNWDILENTEENILTLITCVENEPEFRRCVQAEEKSN